MSQGSNSLFTNKSKYRLNQLFGYQDADEHRENENRLRDAFQEQHAWNDSMDDADWKINFPNWNLGAHRGTVGIDMRGIGNDETFFFGDGSGLTNLTKGGMGDLSQKMYHSNSTLNVGYGGIIQSGNLLNDYWYQGWLAYVTATASIPSGTYWGDYLIAGTDYIKGGPNTITLSTFPMDMPGGNPWHYLGGTFTMHHRCIFSRYAQGGATWSGSNMTLRFRLVGENGVVYGTNGAGDANGYADGNISLPVPTTNITWNVYPFLIETKFDVQNLPAQRYRIQYGLTTPDYGLTIRSSCATWVGVPQALMFNSGGSYPNITAPGYWEITQARFNALYGAFITKRTGHGAWNTYMTWTTAD